MTTAEPTPDWAEPTPEQPVSDYIIQSAQVDQLYAALAKCFGELDNIGKQSKAKIDTKKGGSYSYNYADRGAILEATRTIIAGCGLFPMQVPTRSESAGVTSIGTATRICHASGQWMEFASPVEVPLEDHPNAQAIGSAYTYSMRYGYNMAFQLATVDDDGKEATMSAARRGVPSGADYDPDGGDVQTTGLEVRRRIMAAVSEVVADQAEAKGAAAAFWLEHGKQHEVNAWVPNATVARLMADLPAWIAANVHQKCTPPPSSEATCMCGHLFNQHDDRSPEGAGDCTVLGCSCDRYGGPLPASGTTEPERTEEVLTMDQARNMVGAHRMAEISMQVGAMDRETINAALAERLLVTTGTPDEARARLVSAMVNEEGATPPPDAVGAVEPDPGVDTPTEPPTSADSDVDGIIATVKAKPVAQVRLDLLDAGLDGEGKPDQIRARLVQHLTGEAVTA